MKKILLPLALACTLIGHAQMKEGRVVYERTFRFPAINIDPAIAAQMPKTRTDQYELLFGNGQSLLQILPSLGSDDNTFSTGGMVIRFAGGTNDISYHNFEKGIRIDQQEVLDRSFVVSDSIKTLNWKLSEETKTILNHTAHKST